jgi:PPM family protein phosphatase
MTGWVCCRRHGWDSGYRFYEPGQLGLARLIAALRQLQLPLAEIEAILPLEPVGW